MSRASATDPPGDSPPNVNRSTSEALAHELARANRLRQALYDISETSRSEEDLGTLYRELHRIVGTLMYAENFLIATRGRDRGLLRFEYYCDSVDTEITPEVANRRPQEEIEASLTGWVMRRGELVHLKPADVQRIRREEGLHGFGSPSVDWMAAPLRGRHGAFGVVVVQSYDEAIEYGVDDEQLLTFVCDHVAAVLEQRESDRALRRANDELEARVQERTRELKHEIEERRRGERLQRALFRIATLASESLGLDAFYGEIHRVIGELIYARNMFVALADDRRKLLEFVYYEDEVDESSAPLTIPETAEAAGPTLSIYFSGEPLLWSAAEGALPPGARGAPSEAWLGVPLHAGDRVIGVLAVQSYDPAIRYEESDKQLLTFVAQHVGNTIDRWRAKIALQRANDELEGRVRERTRRLLQANDDLRSTLGKLEATQAQLVEAEKMASLGGLVAGVAHEINTPLGVAVTAASHLDRQLARLCTTDDGKGGEAPPRAALLQAIEGLRTGPSKLLRENLQRAARLVASFRQVAADQSTEDRRRFDLARYLEEVLLSLGPEVRRHGHEVVVDLPAEVPMDGYPFALYPIVSNLVLNSLTHAYDDGAHGTLTLSVSADDDRATITYADDGRGMDEADRARIFEPFFKTRRGRGGTGLGMHITYNHVVRLGGTIRAEPAAGGGLRTVITLPRRMRQL